MIAIVLLTVLVILDIIMVIVEQDAPVLIIQQKTVLTKTILVEQEDVAAVKDQIGAVLEEIVSLNLVRVALLVVVIVGKINYVGLLVEQLAHVLQMSAVNTGTAVVNVVIVNGDAFQIHPVQ
jgi:hypothetical protein